MPERENLTPRIYTAGALRNDGEYMEWRRSIEDKIKELEFYHPEGFKHEHSGVRVNGAVSEDITGIRAADGLIAYINETPQTGTITEVLHAVHNDTPTLVLFEEDAYGHGVVGGMVSGNEEDYKHQELKYPVEIKPIEIKANSEDFWFLINYLVGDSQLENFAANIKGDVNGSLPMDIKQWSGCHNATVMAIPGADDIPTAVYDWLESEFGIDAASSVV